MNLIKYYAELNDNDVCVRIISSKEEIKNSNKHIEILEYNETYYYRKWLGDQWSQETYEPSIDTILQDKVKALETENEQLRQQIQQLLQEKELSKQEIAGLQSAMAELTMMMTPQ